MFTLLVVWSADYTPASDPVVRRSIAVVSDGQLSSRRRGVPVLDVQANEDEETLAATVLASDGLG